jgi:hypothetical protein
MTAFTCQHTLDLYSEAAAGEISGVELWKKQMAMAFHDMEAAGISRQAATTLVLIGMQECGGGWLFPRSSTTPINNPILGSDGPPFNPPSLYDETCWPCRTCVGLEPYGGSHYYPGMTADDEMKDWLEQEGYLGAYNQGLGAYAIPASVMNNPNGGAIIRMFEYTLVNRVASALTGFSIGPTQMYLGQSCVVPQNFRPPWGCLDNYPSTWEEIFLFYMSNSIADIAKGIIRFQFKDDMSGSKVVFNADGSYKGTSAGINFLRNWQTGSGQVQGQPTGYTRNLGYYFYHWGDPGEFDSSGYMTWDPSMSQEEMDLYSALQQTSSNGRGNVNGAMQVGNILYSGGSVSNISLGNQPWNPQTTPAQWTGYSFTSPQTGGTVNVVARVGEPHATAIKRVTEKHGYNP